MHQSPARVSPGWHREVAAVSCFSNAAVTIRKFLQATDIFVRRIPALRQRIHVIPPRGRMSGIEPRMLSSTEFVKAHAGAGSESMRNVPPIIVEHSFNDVSGAFGQFA